MKRMAQAPRVMGQFDHPIPPMPAVRYLTRSRTCHRRRELIERSHIVVTSEKPFSLELISCPVMQLP